MFFENEYTESEKELNFPKEVRNKYKMEKNAELSVKKKKKKIIKKNNKKKKKKKKK